MNSQIIPLALSNHESLGILPQMGNRHGLITGATGTGKTISLQVMAEGFSKAGVNVFMADVKGDLSGIAKAGVASEKFQRRLEKLGVDHWQGKGFPVTFWDLQGKLGHPFRATPSDLGPLLLSRLLELNDTQTGVMQMLFRIADDENMLLLDMKDLLSLTKYVSENNKNFVADYGHMAPATLGAIQRRLLALSDEGAETFFGEPMVDINDLLTPTPTGLGAIHLLSAESLMNQPKLYATALLWLLSELFEQLPEAGDLAKPKLVLFFDEAHLLFADAPPVLVEKIEQVVRLIRSKAVGVYFISQNPSDIPDKILGQLGNRVQHALRAFTPADQRAVKAAAQSLRARPGLDTQSVISELGVGEALVSFMDEEGRPQMVSRAMMLPPSGQIGPITLAERQEILAESALGAKYQEEIDRHSAYEILQERAQQSAETQVSSTNSEPSSRRATKEKSLLGDLATSLGRSLMSSVGRQIGREIMRGVMGSFKGGRRR
ncbi:helicase HerA-like domain-containing protein [Thiosulfativibrio zosterae]|uniref:Helicase HerA-like C-terminal domain-containing protein n=1 Tax=Thiosulfativibrio zosterae TaxID=2675053 RepID=A0A6F8PPW2_9GAMM|nr:helicase HerA-like domain-containing protein [Thiosulfativibrio zosterae]BBP44153.1 hypothetical protein THMIRHAT_18990 [Thiosulfativibrio zosterae]